MAWLKSLFGKAPPRIVRVNPSGLELTVEPGETILEQALGKGIAYPHDCTVGTCGACRTKLLSGTVDAITPFGYTLSKEELDAGYILACQSLPKSDLVVEVELQAEGQENVTTKARIAAVTPLTHDIMKVEWAADLPMHYRAGQYVNIRWNGEEIHRSYSFATAPEKSGTTQLVTFIRHVPGGAFTDLLFGGEAEKLDYELDGPHGQFWLRAGKGPILCIAGGSGLAPIVSLLSDAANKRTRRDVVLLFGARGKRDLYGDAEISAIKNAWTAGFDYWPALSETPEANLRAGFVTEHIGAALERLGPDAQAYLCGPPPMIDAAMAELHKQGVPLDAIFYDKFTDASTAQS
jgi:p-cymene methyl-monooxygenase electron transfer component